jgi:hypothetical protein
MYISLNIKLAAGAVGARVTLRYGSGSGSGSTKMMQLWLRDTRQSVHSVKYHFYCSLYWSI